MELILGFLTLSFPLLVWLLKTFGLPWFIEQTLFFIYSFVFAFIVGMIFSTGSRLQPGNTAVTAAKIYSADMLGGAFGAILISGFALPLLGIWSSSFVIASVCLLAAVFTSLSGKSSP
jgi:predicted MFS family arabinose efflux permease